MSVGVRVDSGEVGEDDLVALVVPDARVELAAGDQPQLRRAEVLGAVDDLGGEACLEVVADGVDGERQPDRRRRG